MAGDAGKRTGLGSGVTDPPDEEGHPAEYQDQGLARAGQDIKNSRKVSPNLQQDPGQRFIRYLRHKPGHPSDFLLPITVGPQRFPIQRPQSPLDRVPANRILPGHELPLHEALGDPRR